MVFRSATKISEIKRLKTDDIQSPDILNKAFEIWEYEILFGKG